MPKDREPLFIDAKVRPLTMDEAAAALSVSRRWLHDFLKEMPPVHMAAGHRKLFDEEAIEAIKAEMKQRAKAAYIPALRPSRVARPLSSFRGQGVESDADILRKLLAKKPRKNSASYENAMRMATMGRRKKPDLD